MYEWKVFKKSGFQEITGCTEKPTEKGWMERLIKQTSWILTLNSGKNILNFHLFVLLSFIFLSIQFLGAIFYVFRLFSSVGLVIARSLLWLAACYLPLHLTAQPSAGREDKNTSPSTIDHPEWNQTDFLMNQIWCSTDRQYTKHLFQSWKHHCWHF